MWVVEKVAIALIWIAVPVTVGLALAFDSRLVPLNTDAAADVGRTLILLIFVFLIVERALEAIVSAWREPGKRSRQPSGDGEPSSDFLDYTQMTRIITLALALLMGLLVSAVGIRVLEPIVDSSSLGELGSQARWFRSVDVLLTGGVISGGSEGVHKLMKVYDKLTSSAS